MSQTPPQSNPEDQMRQILQSIEMDKIKVIGSGASMYDLSVRGWKQLAEGSMMQVKKYAERIKELEAMVTDLGGNLNPETPTKPEPAKKIVKKDASKSVSKDMKTGVKQVQPTG